MLVELVQQLTVLSVIPEFWIEYLPNALFPFNLTDLLRVVFIIPFLVFLAIKDFQTRRIHEYTWVPVLALGVLLLAHDLIFGPVMHFSDGTVIEGVSPFLENLKQYGPLLAANIVLAGAIGIIFNKLDLFGGADLRAFIVIALFIPWWPNASIELAVLEIGTPAFPAFIPPQIQVWNPVFLGILQWTALLGLLYPIKLFIENKTNNTSLQKPTFEPSIYTYFLAKPMTVNNFTNSFGRTLYNKNGKITKDGLPSKFIRQYIRWHNDNTDDEIEKATELQGRKLFIGEFLNASTERDDADDWAVPTDEDGEWDTEEIEMVENEVRDALNSDSLWVMPEAPFLVPFSIGTVLTLFIGDPMTLLITLL